MPSRPTSRHADGVLRTGLRTQLERIEALEKALWAAPGDSERLREYQAAFREYERLLASAGDDDRRHRFIVVIPVADSPRHLRNCLQSLLQQCRDYGYGGVAQGRFRKVSVLLADDSADTAHMARNREIAQAIDAQGLSIEYFGLDEQRALMDTLTDIDLRGIVGEHAADDYAHKGQAMMRNIAYLKLAAIHAQCADERLLFYTIDADQAFAVNVPTAQGGRDLAALNYFYQLDRLFDRGGVQVLTGKVVGDPPVSPAVMAANFLDDVIAFVDEMHREPPHAAYRQPELDTRGSGEAAYHDMADMFGFAQQADSYRFRSLASNEPDNAQAFAEFAAHLNRFLHGEHPTRITWYRHQQIDHSVQPARTVYTGNYVFGAQALQHFIPFAPLRLRMSGPTMGRVLKLWLGDAFVSANVPMLHRRTLDATGAAEYRPGVIDSAAQVDLADEFERQFHGDVMLFSVERLCVAGYPRQPATTQQVEATLDAVRLELHTKYAARRQAILQRCARLRALLGASECWWHASAHASALQAFTAFIDNIERNFGGSSAAAAHIDDAGLSGRWGRRQSAAIASLGADRAAWQAALARLRSGAQG